jgi:hypothetical protein
MPSCAPSSSCPSSSSAPSPLSYCRPSVDQRPTLGGGSPAGAGPAPENSARRARARETRTWRRLGAFSRGCRRRASPNKRAHTCLQSARGRGPQWPPINSRSRAAAPPARRRPRHRASRRRLRASNERAGPGGVRRLVLVPPPLPMPRRQPHDVASGVLHGGVRLLGALRSDGRVSIRGYGRSELPASRSGRPRNLIYRENMPRVPYIREEVDEDMPYARLVGGIRPRSSENAGPKLAGSLRRRTRRTPPVAHSCRSRATRATGTLAHIPRRPRRTSSARAVVRLTLPSRRSSTSGPRAEGG